MMVNSVNDKLVNSYLRELKTALREVSPRRRREMISEFAEHIAVAGATLDANDEVGLRNVLEQLGDPEVLGKEMMETESISPTRPSDAFVPWLIFLGAILFGIGWLVGVVLLWRSATWRLFDKLLGTLVLPGGLFAFLLVRPTVKACSSYGSPGQKTLTHCVSSGLVVTAPWNVVLAVLLVGAPIAVFTRLLWVRNYGYGD